MTGLATQETNNSVSDYIESIENKSKRNDAKTLLKLMEEVTGKEAKIWGTQSIIAFGKYKYKRKGGKEEFEWFNVGFAPRKNKITVYLTMDINEHADLVEKLGKCKWGKGCLYINKLADIDMAVLRQLIDRSKGAGWYG